MPKAAETSADLLQLLSLSPSASLQAEEVALRPIDDMFPATVFRCHSQTTPSLAFGDATLPEIPLQGDGYRAQHWFKARALPIAKLQELLRGRVLWIDHTGINIPPQRLPLEWEDFIKGIGNSSALYAYPTGEPWFFILPATEREVDCGIQSFPSGRQPRFEIVEMAPGSCVGIQLDIQTDFSRQEMEEALPAPLGVSLHGLEDYFRSVFLEHNWAGLEIRIDLRFGPGQPLGDWETGKWLAQSGQRCSKQVQRIPRAVDSRR